jgi:hypothetical protein
MSTPEQFERPTYALPDVAWQTTGAQKQKPPLPGKEFRVTRRGPGGGLAR